MSLRIWRFAALLLTALTLGMGLCHVMELPARISWDQPLWVGATVTGGLYRMFGTLGAAIDLAAIACSIVVAAKTRGTPAFRLSALNAAMFTLALLLWFAIVFPVNLELAGWVSGPVPSDWASFRLRWESGHAINTLLQLIGFCALLWSVVRETERA
jgi:hypothetical protein